MSVKKQLPSLSKLYTIYGEVPESFLDKTDVDSYFYYIILDVALIDNRIVRVSKGSNKKICFQTILVLELEKSSCKTEIVWRQKFFFLEDSFLKRSCQFH